MSSKVLLIFNLLVSLAWCHTTNEGPVRDVNCIFNIDPERGYTCELVDFLYFNEDERVRFVGQQQGGNTNEDVDTVFIHDSQTHFIPFEQIMHYFTNLKHLDVQRSNMKQLTQLANGYSLVTVTMKHNGIQSLDAGLFIECASLENLDLSHNEIFRIHENALGSLKSVVDVNLSHNKIQHLKRKTVKPLKNVKILNLRANNLKDLPHDLFNDLFHLTDLDISENPIIRLDFRTFDFTVHLEHLKLGSLQIKTIHKYVFKNLRRLVTLDISKNDMKTVDGEILSTNKNLETLFMNDCNIMGIGRQFFDKLDALKGIYATGNQCVDGVFSGNIVDYRPKFLKCFQNFDDMKDMMFLNKGGTHRADEL